MKCIKCGRKSKDKYCEKCYLDETSLIKNYKKINLTVCQKCGRHHYKNKWFKDKIRELIKDNIVFDDNFNINKIDYELSNKEIKVTVDASYGKQNIQQDFDLSLKRVKKTCKDCSKKGQYFESILQLRNSSEDVVTFIEKTVEKQEPGVFINKKLKVRGGIDFYLTSNKFARKLGKKLQQNFGGEFKVSPKLHTKDRHSGKELYRLSVLFRPSEFRKEDIISSNDKIIKIKNVANKITGINIVNNKKVIIDYTKAKPKTLKVHEVTVSKTYPSLEVIHPKTFQSIKVENPKKTTQKQLKIVIHNDKAYIV